MAVAGCDSQTVFGDTHSEAPVPGPSTPAVSTAPAPATSTQAPSTATTSPPAVAAGVPDGVQAARVERIVDGDTIAVRALAEGEVLESTAQITVRLLEIDTPETKQPGTPVQCYGREATAFTERLLPVGTKVWVLPDEERTDRYGRDLLYVWTTGGVFANREIVRTGHGKAVLYPPNDLYIDQMRDAEAEARSGNVGMWAACGGAAAGPAESAPAAGQAAGSSTDPRFPSCRAAKTAGFGPYVRGSDPEYGWYRDGDSDGTVCE